MFHPLLTWSCLRRLCWSLAVLLLLPGMISRVKGQTTSENPAAKLAAPPVTVKEGEIDMGSVFMMEQRRFFFTVVNNSDQLLEYENIAISCSCTTSKLPAKGSIPAQGEMRIPVDFNAQKLDGFGPFRKDIIIFFKNYAPLVLYFFGVHSQEVVLTAQIGDNERIVTTVPIGFVPTVDLKWFQPIKIKANFQDGRKLAFAAPIITNDQFIAEMLQISDLEWQLTIKPKLPMQYGAVTGAVALPFQEPDNKGAIVLPLMGVVGSKITSTTDDMLVDTKTDPAVVRKTLALTRAPYEDRNALKARAIGKANPYYRYLKRLTVDEVGLPEVPGVKFELEQGRGGVYVHCTMTAAQLTEEGVKAEFKVQNSASAVVRFALMSDEIRALIEENKKQQKELEGEEEDDEEEEEDGETTEQEKNTSAVPPRHRH